MHLIKLCVGIETARAIRTGRRSAGEAEGLPASPRVDPPHPAHARGRRRVLDSGSLYWVIKGIDPSRARKSLELREETDAEGRSLCGIVLDIR